MFFDVLYFTYSRWVITSWPDYLLASMTATPGPAAYGLSDEVRPRVHLGETRMGGS